MEEEPYIFGTTGKGEVVHQHVLLAEACKSYQKYKPVNPCDDLIKLRTDYPFNHLVQLGLLAIGDPGVIADVYRYCKFYQLIKTLNEKKAVFRSFKRWYDTARDKANESYALEEPDVNEAYKSFKTHYAQLVHNYNLECLQTIDQCIEIEDRLIVAKTMGQLEAVLPQILHTVRESGASRTFWGEIPSTIMYPSLPDPIPTASPEPVIIPPLPGTSPALEPMTSSVSPTPSFLLADQLSPSSGPVHHGCTHTPS